MPEERRRLALSQKDSVKRYGDCAGSICDEIRRQEEQIAQVRKNLVRRPTLRGGAASLST